MKSHQKLWCGQILVVAVVCAAAMAGWGAASSAPTQEVQEQIPTIKKEVRLVLVEATVKDKGGKAMKILKQEDFLLFEEGQAQEIAHFSQDQLPLAVAMVVDLSGSIQPFLRPLRYASMSALKALKKEDEVALFTFTQYVDRRVDLTHDKLSVSDQIEFFEAGGATNINDGVYEAAKYLLEKAPAARRVIVLVSDNVPTAGGYSPNDVLNEALEADAAVYSLKVPGRNPIGAKALSVGRGLVNVKKLCEETGGEIFEVEKEGSLYLAFAALIERLKTRYTLGFYPGSNVNATERKLRKLEVKLHPSFGVKGKDYSVVAKRGYFPATK
ncbi:MAG: VWA domain-containing protein [Acidobacteria bacterium]|nr:VWA domain-containing protein [Acidobacteriota bacterium]